VPWLLGLVFAAGYSCLAVLRYRQFDAASWDLGIFTQTVGHYAHFQTPVSDIKGPGFDILGDHFSPVMALLALPYRLFPSAATLLVAQGLLLGLSVVPITRLAISRLGSPAGVGIGVAYGCSWGLQNAVVVDLHETSFAVPLLAFSLEALLDRRWRRSVAWALPLLLVKEDLGLTVAMLGILLMIYGQRRLGALTAILGAAATVVTVLVVIPSLNPGHHYPYSGATAALADPGTKLVTVVLLFAITAFIALRSPISLLVLPTLLWRFAGTNPAYWGTGWHYSAVLMPIVFVALIDGIERLQRSTTPLSRRAAGVAVPVVVTLAALLVVRLPLEALVRPETWRATARQHEAERALARIPAGTTVESDLGLLSHLVSRDDVFWLGGAPSVLPAYIAIDSGSGWSPPVPRALPSFAHDLHPGGRYRLIWSSGGFSVLRLQGQ